MPKTKISEFSSTPANNTDIDSINIAEGCAPSGINDAIRELMAQLKDFQVGSAGDPVTVGGVLTVQAGAVGTPAITTAGDTNTGIFFPAADTIAFAEGGAEIARFDSSGNLGLGVTPSAWSGYKVLQAGIASFAGGSSGAYLLQDNAYTDNSGGAWKYINSGYAASQYYAASGSHVWRTAASGTAGNAITFTQAMTLNASGNLLIGTTSATAFGKSIVVNSSTTSGTLYQVSGTDQAGMYADSGNTYIFSNNNPLIFGVAGGGGTERARIDSSGNFAIGTSSPAFKLDVYRGSSGVVLNLEGIGDYNAETGISFTSQRAKISGFLNGSGGTPGSTLRFYTMPNGGSVTERVRIDSDGNLLVGCTSTPSSSVVGWRATVAGDQGYMSSSAGSSGAREHWYLYNTNGLVGTVSTSGTSTTYATSSDYRLKENIAPMRGALATVAQLKPCTYTWKTDGAVGQGFIAHELQAVLPDAVVGEKDAIDAEGNPKYQGIDTSFLVATLTAAIQELKAEFDAYKASHP